MNAEELKMLEDKALEIRRLTVDMIGKLGVGHIGGSVSMIEAIVVLYYKYMNIDPKNPKWENRDRFVLSKGHAAPALYSVLANRGYFDVELLKTLRHQGSILQGHPDLKHIPGVDMSTGSLGQGISTAVGMALAAKVSGKDYRVYSILGDGEVAEGQVWEAMMAANKYHLDNLCACVDVNGLQIDGATKDVMPTEPLDKKFEAFGWKAIMCNGHDMQSLLDAFEEAKKTVGQPTVVIAKTYKGHGVSFMEDVAGWHGKAPNDEQLAQAIEELGGEE